MTRCTQTKWNPRWIAAYTLLTFVHFDQIQIAHSNAVQRGKLRGQIAANRMLKQPPRTFELACKLELSNGELTDHEFAQFISTYCRDNIPGPACTTYSFRELPLAIKLPFVSNLCPDDPASEMSCLHDLITSGDTIAFTGDVGKLCSITHTMMKDNFFFDADLPRLKHYYGNEVPPPDSKIQSEGVESQEIKHVVYTPRPGEQTPPEYKSVVYTPDEVEDEKTVKQKPTRHPTAYKKVVLSQEDFDEFEVAGSKDGSVTPKGSSKLSAVSTDGASLNLTSTVPSTAPQAKDEDLPEVEDEVDGEFAEAGTGDNSGEARTSSKLKKSSKVPAVPTDSWPSIIVAAVPSSQPQLQEKETESTKGFVEAEVMKPILKSKKSTKAPATSAPAPTAVPSTAPPFAPQAEVVEGNEEAHIALSPSTTVTTPLPVQGPSEEPAIEFAKDLRNDVDLDINLGPYAQMNEDASEEETVKSPDSSLAGLATGAAVVTLFGVLGATKINKGRKRRRKEFLLSNDPTLFDDGSVASERSYSHGYGDTKESKPWPQLKNSSVEPEASVLLKTVSEAFRSAGFQQLIENSVQEHDDVEAPSQERKTSQSPAPCQMSDTDPMYLEESAASFHHVSSNDNDIVTLVSREAQKRDVLASNGARETIVEVLAAAEDQKLLLADLNQKSYFVGESMLNENVSSLPPSEADPMEAYDEVETSGRGQIKPFVEKYLRPKKKIAAEKEVPSAGVPLDDFELPPRVEDNNLDSISRSSSFSFTKREKRDLEDISQEIENDDKRPWRQGQSASIDFGRSRSCSRSRSNTEENIFDLDRVASMLKSLPNESQRSDSELTDEASVEGGSFLSEDMLKQFKAVDQSLSAGFREFKETDVRLTEGYDKLREELMDTEQVSDDLSNGKGPPKDITEKPVMTSNNLEEASHASSVPVIGDVVEDFEGFQFVHGYGNDATERESAASSRSANTEKNDSDEKSSNSDESVGGEGTQDEEQVDDFGSQESEEDSGSDESSASSDENSVECKKKTDGRDGSRSPRIGTVEDQGNEGDTPDDDDDDDDEEVADFSTLRSLFAATWHLPGQQEATTLRPSTPPRLDGTDFVGNQPASLLAPVISSDEEDC